MQSSESSIYVPIYQSSEVSAWRHHRREHELLLLIPIIPAGQNVDAIGIELNREAKRGEEISVGVIPTESGLQRRSLKELNEVWFRELNALPDRHALYDASYYPDSHPFYKEGVQGAGSVILRCGLNEFDVDEINVLHALGVKAAIPERIIRTVRDVIESYCSRALLQGPESQKQHFRALTAQLANPQLRSQAAHTAIM